MLRSSKLHPQISGQCHLNGEFDYTKTPILPLGTKATIFIPPKDRIIWDCHTIEGYYLRTSLDHYKCHRIYIPETRGVRTSNTVEFHPTYCKMSYVSSIEEALIEIKKLIASIGKTKTQSSFSLKDEKIENFQNLAKIFKKKKMKNTSQHRVVEKKEYYTIEGSNRPYKTL